MENELGYIHTMEWDLAIKRMNYWYTKKYEQISKEWHCVKETSQKVVLLYDLVYLSETDL